MAAPWLYRGFGLGGAGLILLLFAHNELARRYGPAGFYVDLMLPRPLSLTAFLLSTAATAAVAIRGDRGRPATALLIVTAAVAASVLAARSICYSWESKTLIDAYGPFVTVRRGIDADKVCVDSDALSFRIADGDRRIDLFRGIPPLRFSADALTSNLALEPCPSPDLERRALEH